MGEAKVESVASTRHRKKIVGIVRDGKGGKGRALNDKEGRNWYFLSIFFHDLLYVDPGEGRSAIDKMYVTLVVATIISGGLGGVNDPE